MLDPFPWSRKAREEAARVLDEDAQELFAIAGRVARRAEADSVGAGHVHQASRHLRIGKGVPRTAEVLSDGGWAFLGLNGGGLLSFWLADTAINAVGWLCILGAVVAAGAVGIGYTMKASSR
jgi:hypothetical protein